MPFCSRFGIVVIWVGSLLFVGVWSSSSAQPQPQTPVEPYVLSGTDLGFRVESRRGDTPRGQIVVRINGQWVPVILGTGLSR